jgi:hypothetical protein
MFSKPLPICSAKKNTKQSISNDFQLSYSDYMKNNINIKTLRKEALRSVSKQHKLHISGNKTVLAMRIEKFFVDTTHSIKIQKIIRGYIIRYSFKSRGPALFKRELCVNATDFVTLEPIVEISHSQFFSYTDNKGFVYGFDIYSLINIYIRKGKLANPYNREKIDQKIIKTIFSLNNIIYRLYPEVYQENIINTNIITPVNHIVPQNRVYTPANTTNTDNVAPIMTQNNSNLVIDLTGDNNEQEPPTLSQRLSNIRNRQLINQPLNIIVPVIDVLQITNLMPTNLLPTNLPPTNLPPSDILRTNSLSQSDRIRQSQISNLLNSMRQKTVPVRIEEIFMEIDLLGNYTQSQWFSQLNKSQCIRFISILYDIWVYRSQLSSLMQINICCVQDPFTNIPFQSILLTKPLLFVQAQCLNIIECMVCSGINSEYSKIGTMHVLSALTIVSIPARLSMNWLYESLM